MAEQLETEAVEAMLVAAIAWDEQTFEAMRASAPMPPYDVVVATLAALVEAVLPEKVGVSVAQIMDKPPEMSAALAKALLVLRILGAIKATQETMQ
jgi:hypothetical protein